MAIYQCTPEPRPWLFGDIASAKIVVLFLGKLECIRLKTVWGIIWPAPRCTFPLILSRALKYFRDTRPKAMIVHSVSASASSQGNTWFRAH
ncbi:hypothetical protein BofuT4_uP014230.1 [Botrytis cinerea T4]|uniref:Uncharacterized protein n=1 Tax=Botryotinia fuckeliana (strain T4) TaxID=999810 RepID=G2XN39_BOTF4|nr:hypothetical protein BofuT4_uP014230.1 [Botrytis cinerea T4]